MKLNNPIIDVKRHPSYQQQSAVNANLRYQTPDEIAELLIDYHRHGSNALLGKDVALQQAWQQQSDMIWYYLYWVAAYHTLRDVLSYLGDAHPGIIHANRWAKQEAHGMGIPGF